MLSYCGPSNRSPNWHVSNDHLWLHGVTEISHGAGSPPWAHQLMQLGKRSLNKFRASTGFEPGTSANTGAMLYQLSYEATHWEPGHFCGFYLSHEGNRWKNKCNFFARRREASNCTILTVSPPIYAIGKKIIYSFRDIWSTNVEYYKNKNVFYKRW